MTRQRMFIIGGIICGVLLLSWWAWGIARGYQRRAIANRPAPATTLADANPCLSWPYQLDRVVTHVHSVLSVPPKFAHATVNINPGEYDHALAPDPFVILAAAKAKGCDLRFAEHGEVLSAGSWLRLKDAGYQGFEWTLGGVIGGDTVDHVAVYGTDSYAGTRNALDASRWAGTECPDLPTLYEWLAGVSGDWYGVLCHPWLGASQFNRFALAPQGGVQRRLVGIGAGGGEHPRQHDDLADGEACYRQALGQGWVLMPVYEADNFANPVNRPGFRERFTGLWLPKGRAVTRAAQTDACLARRGYATVSGLELRFAALNVNHATTWQVMGESFAAPAGPADPVRCQFAILGWLVGISSPVCRVVGLDAAGTAVSVQELTVADLDVFTTAGRNGYIATVDQPANGSAVCYYLAVERNGLVVGLTAPIWVDGRGFTRPKPIAAPPLTPIRPLPTPTTALPSASAPPAVSYRAGWEEFPVDTGSRFYTKLRVGEQVELWLRQHSDTRQHAVRISQDGNVVWAYHFRWARDLQTWTKFNDRAGESRYAIEVFAEDRARGWYRLTDCKYQYPWGVTPAYPGAEGAQSINFESDMDADYDDLTIEAGFSFPRRR